MYFTFLFKESKTKLLWGREKSVIMQIWRIIVFFKSSFKQSVSTSGICKKRQISMNFQRHLKTRKMEIITASSGLITWQNIRVGLWTIVSLRKDSCHHLQQSFCVSGVWRGDIHIFGIIAPLRRLGYAAFQPTASISMLPVTYCRHPTVIMLSGSYCMTITKTHLTVGQAYVLVQSLGEPLKRNFWFTLNRQLVWLLEISSLTLLDCCTGCWFSSGPNLRYWFWPLNIFIAWNQCI